MRFVTPASRGQISTRLLQKCPPEAGGTKNFWTVSGVLPTSQYCLLLFSVLLYGAFLYAQEPHMEIVRELAAMGPRVYGTEASERAAHFVRDRLLSYGIKEVKLQPFEAEGRKGINVIAVIPGKDRSKQIILGAHHDSAPGAPGAYDDGGGTSVLLNVARHFVSVQPQFTLVFCSFDAEEAGFLGSLAYVKRVTPQEAARTLFMLCMEMMGWEQGYPNIQTLRYEIGGRNPQIKDIPTAGIAAPRSLVSLITETAGSAEMDFALGDPFLSPLYQVVTRVVKVGYYGDDISFLIAGIPAVLVTDSSFSAFYPHYHTPQDLPQYVSEERLAGMDRLITRIVDRAKAEDFSSPITSKRQQEYWILGPVILNFYVLLFLFLASQVLLSWYCSKRSVLSFRLTLYLLIETSLAAILFYRYPTFTFFVVGLSAFLYLLCETIRFRSRFRMLLIYLPHIAVSIFAVSAWLKGYIYGAYLTIPDLALLIGVVALSLVRVLDGS